MPIIILAVIVSFFLAMNVGANNSAAEMGAAYGAGVRTKRQAVALIAIFASIGALTAGQPVIKTLGGGLVTEAVFKEHFRFIFIVLFVAAFFDFLANWRKIPIPTTHAIVCAIVGIGLYRHSLAVGKFTTIILWWIISPLVAFFISFFIGKYFYFKILEGLAKFKSEEKIKKFLSRLIVISGCYTAFSGGANGTAKAVGPLVAAGMVNLYPAAILGGVGISLGALFFGGRVLETVGKGITEIGIVRAILVEFICGTTVFLASIYGIPVSISETMTSSIIGLSCAKVGLKVTGQNEHVSTIIIFWLAVPFLATAMAYGLAYLSTLCLG